MMLKNKLEMPSIKQLLVPVLTALCLICLGRYLVDQPLSADLADRKNLLIQALGVTIGLLVVGSLYSYLCQARIQSYLCAVCLLMGIGFCYQFFFSDFSNFVKLTYMGLAVGITVYLVYRRINMLCDWMFWVCAALIVLLLLINIVFAQEVNGARLWIDLKVFTFQPSELVKVLLILLSASAFQNPVRSAAYCALSLLSCGVFLLLRDLGGVVVIFALFMFMVYLLFDNRLLSVGIMIAAVIALVVAVRILPYASARFTNCFRAMDDGNDQQRDFIIGTLMGGFKGLGVTDHKIFTDVYAAENDGALAGVMAVLGTPVMLITMASYALVAGQAALNRSVYTSSFFILIQLGVYIAVHALLNFGGATDTLPFTGVVAPMISSGGSAMLSFGILLGLGAAALNPHMNYYKEA